MAKYWKIGVGNIDCATFLDALSKSFPEATTLYVEGTDISDDVKKCYNSHLEEGNYIAPTQTIWPKSEKYRLRFSRNLMDCLFSLAMPHAEPEFLDHLALYRESEELLSWPDAFSRSSPMVVSRSVPESVVSQFAAELGLGYQLALG